MRFRPLHGFVTLLLVLVGSVSGIVGHQLNNHPRIQAAFTKTALLVDREGTKYLKQFGFSCGVESWNIKTMQDPAANQVNLTPKATTIPQLTSLGGPSGQRLSPPRVWQLSGTRLAAYKLEPDSDIHLVLRSVLGSHPTMIAEIPSPGCAPNSFVLNQIVTARAAFVAQVGTPQTYFVNVDDSVTLAGVGFVDFAHGQTGADQNQVELHPVISFKRNL